MSELARVRFKLERDEYGFPPAEIEILLAEELGSDLYRIVSTPIFAFGVSNQDVVRGAMQDGKIFAESIVQEGGHSTMRLLIRGNNLNHPESLQKLSDLRTSLGRLGCTWIHSKIPGLTAIDIPSETRIEPIYHLLRKEHEKGWLGVDEAAISLVHRTQE